jgi:hypothetical protein
MQFCFRLSADSSIDQLPIPEAKNGKRITRSSDMNRAPKRLVPTDKESADSLSVCIPGDKHGAMYRAATWGYRRMTTGAVLDKVDHLSRS